MTLPQSALDQLLDAIRAGDGYASPRCGTCSVPIVREPIPPKGDGRPIVRRRRAGRTTRQAGRSTSGARRPVPRERGCSQPGHLAVDPGDPDAPYDRRPRRPASSPVGWAPPPDPGGAAAATLRSTRSRTAVIPWSAMAADGRVAAPAGDP